MIKLSILKKFKKFQLLVSGPKGAWHKQKNKKILFYQKRSRLWFFLTNKILKKAKKAKKKM